MNIGPLCVCLSPAYHIVGMRRWVLTRIYMRLNPKPDSETAPVPTPTTNNAAKWGPFDGLLLPRGAVRIRFALSKKRNTTRRSINKVNNQSMLLDHWPTLRSPSFPISTQIRTYTPPSRVVSIPLDGNLIRIIRSDMIPRCGPNTLSNTHPLPQHSSLGDLEPTSADYSPSLEHIHTFIHEEIYQEPLCFDDRSNPPPSPLEAAPEAMALSAESPPTHGALRSGRKIVRRIPAFV